MAVPSVDGVSKPHLGLRAYVNPNTKSKTEKGLFKCVEITNRRGHGIEKNQKI